MATVSFKKAQRWYPGMDKPAVPGIDLEIHDGEFMVLVGPSGCGKSTTLRMLAGLEEVNEGQIFIGDRDITNLPPKDRDIAMVFQNYALYPHMTVADNMAFSLKMAKVKESERKERVAEAAKILGLTEYLDRKPKALSGGQRQRVAMGRAIVRKPQVFCMDEPLSNLDAKMRVQTRTDIAKLQQDLGVTTVYVTHDQVEAMTMGDRVAVMKDGYLQQVDPAAAAKMQGEITVGVRPESWRVVGNSDAGLPVRVTVVEDLGADAFVHGTSGVEGTPNNIVIRVSGRNHPKKGETMYVTTDPQSVHVF